MNPELICCNLETAKKLKKAGWGKDTVFVWSGGLCYKDDFSWPCMDGVYPAPTSSEIELPRDYGCFNFIEKFVCGELDFTLMGYETIEWIEDSKADSEVEAKCKAWLWLKEEGLI